MQEVLRAAKAWEPDTVALAVLEDGIEIAAYGPRDTVLPWASVTKLVSATAVLTLVDDGTIALEDPAGPADATVRHLLAHAAGYPFDGVEPMQPVERRRVYSNTGFEVLARHVEEVTSVPFTSTVFANVLLPLGMHDTVMDGSPAKDGRGPLGDLLSFVEELAFPTLISEDLAREARTVQYPPLAGVLPGYGRQDPNPWGLGYEIRGDKQPHWTGRRNSPSTFGHFGQSGSFVWVDPEAGVAMCGLADRAFGAWAQEAWPAMADAVLGDLGVSGDSS